jgi:hypothetical protein
MKIMNDFEKNGFAIFSFELTKNIIFLQEIFENNYLTKFTESASTNRRVIKLFAEDPSVKSFFINNNLLQHIKGLGVNYPVCCGPIVTHFTSLDSTGNGFGLNYHQDYPSMGSSINSVIVWTSLFDTTKDTHSISIVPGSHKLGVLPGVQSDNGYLVNKEYTKQAIILEIKAGNVLVMSPFLVHATYINPNCKEKYKLSLSTRFDDLNDPSWKIRTFVNAYSTLVDREIYLKK